MKTVAIPDDILAKVRHFSDGGDPTAMALMASFDADVAEQTDIASVATGSLLKKTVQSGVTHISAAVLGVDFMPVLDVADTAAAQAINTTGLSSGVRLWLRTYSRRFVFDATSTAPALEGKVVAPTTGPGRWIAEDLFSAPYDISAVLTAGPYSAGTRELVRADVTTAGFTVNLPALSNELIGKAEVIVRKMDTSGNAITIAAATDQTVNGAATSELSASGGSIHLIAVSATAWLSV